MILGGKKKKIPAGVSGFFIDIQSFRSHCGPGVDPTSNRNEYRDYFLVVRLTTLPPSCAVVMKSGNCNFLEPSGPLQACNGTDLPFTNTYIHVPAAAAAAQVTVYDKTLIKNNFLSLRGYRKLLN